ncbi:MAG: hypothetical protein M5U09_18430 [Gammaproteobacteria bacterium]|nr:hypothetical protein [Gammaproteobacteria bacterium]
MLVYLGGAPEFTDKTHSYWAGETIRKQIVWIWDGPGQRTLDGKWSLVDAAGKVLDSATVTKTLLPGAVNMTAIETSAPQVTGRRDLTLNLTVTEGGATVAKDSFALQVHSAYQPITATAALLDPVGKSRPWLEWIGVKVIAWEQRDEAQLWIVGREALERQARVAVHDGRGRRRAKRPDPGADTGGLGGDGSAVDRDHRCWSHLCPSYRLTL